MIRITLIALATLCAEAAARAGDLSPAATQPAGANPAAIFDRLIGTWLGDHQGTGEADRARVVYESGIADQLIKCRSFTVNRHGEPKLRYETFIYYHPGLKQLRSISVGSTGGVFDGSVAGTRDELHFEFSAYLKDQKVDYRQSIRFLGDDRYEWLVWQKQGDEWKKVIEGTFTREAGVSLK